MEGPKAPERGAEAQSGLGCGEGSVAPSQYEGLEA